MRTRTMVVLLSLLVLPIAGASLIEKTTGTPYQHDGGKHGDAPDACSNAPPNYVRGSTIEGTLVPRDDERDFWFVELHVEQFVRIQVYPTPASDYAPYASVDPDLRVWAPAGQQGPACGELIGESSRNRAMDEVAFHPRMTGVYAIEVYIHQTVNFGPLSLPTDAVTRVCHPACTGEGTYKLTSG